MRPVNLLPPEDRRGEAAPLRAGNASYVLIGILAAALLGVVAMVLAGNSIKDSKAQLASLQAREAAAQQAAAKLAPYQNFASTSQARVDTVTSLAKSRFDWDRVLREMALVIPDDVWLESMSGTVAPGVDLGEGASDAGASDPTITGPSIHIIGCARTTKGVAGFVSTLQDIDGVTRVGVSSSALGEAETGSESVDPEAGQTGSCQTKAYIAKFDITVAFDAVPASQFTPGAEDTGLAAALPATTGTTGTTGATGATGTTGAAGTTGTTDDGGVAATGAEQQSATDSAAQQTDKAKNGASNVGIGN